MKYSISSRHFLLPAFQIHISCIPLSGLFASMGLWAHLCTLLVITSRTKKKTGSSFGNQTETKFEFLIWVRAKLGLA